MNTAVILTLIFGGILFFILDTIFFDINQSNIKWILMCIIALVPVLSLIAYGVSFFCCIFNYEKDGTKYTHKDYHHDIYVKDTKLNRWLFNDVEWSFIDAMNNSKKYN